MHKHASVIIALALIMLVATACLVRTSRPRGQRAQPVYVEKHKHKKHDHKHKKHKHKKHRD